MACYRRNHPSAQREVWKVDRMFCSIGLFHIRQFLYLIVAVLVSIWRSTWTAFSRPQGYTPSRKGWAKHVCPRVSTLRTQYFLAPLATILLFTINSSYAECLDPNEVVSLPPGVTIQKPDEPSTRELHPNEVVCANDVLRGTAAGTIILRDKDGKITRLEAKPRFGRFALLFLTAIAGFGFIVLLFRKALVSSFMFAKVCYFSSGLLLGYEMYIVFLKTWI